MTGNHRPENEARIDVQKKRPEDYYETTDKPIIEEEINEAIRHFKNNEANVWDGIPGDVLKHIYAVLLYLNRILDSGYFPEFWSKSIAVPISNKGDADSPQSGVFTQRSKQKYSPISSTSATTFFVLVSFLTVYLLVHKTDFT